MSNYLSPGSGAAWLAPQGLGGLRHHGLGWLDGTIPLGLVTPISPGHPHTSPIPLPTCVPEVSHLQPQPCYPMLGQAL